jgi:hypothetical protein
MEKERVPGGTSGSVADRVKLRGVSSRTVRLPGLVKMGGTLIDNFTTKASEGPPRLVSKPPGVGKSIEKV